MEELRREAEKLENVLREVQEDNSMLETDLEKYKETVKVLNNQNEELITELDKISSQDLDTRNLLNRKERIDALIAKAESHLLRRQV